MGGRVSVRLHGGPFDGMIVLAPKGAVEFELPIIDGFVFYEIKGRWASYIGVRPLTMADIDDPGEPL